MERIGDDGTYTEVGDEGIDAGDREPRRLVRRCCDVLLESRCSLVGLARLELEVIWRRSVGEWAPMVDCAVASRGNGLRRKERDLRVKSDAR